MPTKPSSSRPIVCGVDDSDGSRGAVAFAGRLAEGFGVELVLAHVSTRDAYVPAGMPLETARIRALVAATEREPVERLARSADIADYRWRRVESGPPAEGLRAVVRSERAALLVVGSRGRGLVGTALLGSVSEEVSREAPCPVVVVPPTGANEYLAATRRPVVVCGIDGSGEALEAAGVSGELARRLGWRVVLVHAFSPSAPMRAAGTPGVAPRDVCPVGGPERRKAQRRLGRAVEAVGSGLHVETALEIADPVGGLLEIADREDAEMVVVGSRGRGPLRAVVFGSISREIAAMADRPVLIVAGDHEAAGLLPHGRARPARHRLRQPSRSWPDQPPGNELDPHPRA